MKTIGDCKVGSDCKMVVSSQGHRISFPTKILDILGSSKKYGNGIFVEAVYHEDHRINFDGVKVTMEYFDETDRRLYTFNVNNIGYDYDNDRLLLCSRQMAIPINNRRAFRIDCGYDVVLHLNNVSHPIGGYCRDISYLGAAYVFTDKNRAAKIGSMVKATIKVTGKNPNNIPDCDVVGKIVRIMDNWIGGRTLIGVEFATTPKDIERLVRDLQMKELRRRSGKSNDKPTFVK